MTDRLYLATLTRMENSIVQGKFQISYTVNSETPVIWRKIDFEIRMRRKDAYEDPNIGPDFIYCMTGRYFCCGENIGSYGRFKTALTECNHRGSRFHTVRTGNITNEVRLGQYSFAPAEFFWTDIKFVNGSKFEAIDCNNTKISIDPAAYAPEYILSVFNFMYPGKNPFGYVLKIKTKWIFLFKSR